ncbi:hypothetical protein [Archangium lipolyticum]|uniref:hypothetical protein n=1 Tax=Archangium lipolyticum TaxID=2970465 RepID=UPI00214A6648|nr:hypothetical protein [Archangium lipolyticum]
MDEKKKPESNWEEAERLGPYQIHEQVPQSAHEQGELYRATHETSGATALVFKPADEEGAVPLKDWRVHFISSASSGCVAMEVVHTPWSVAPDKHSVEALTFLFERVHEGVQRMARAFPNTHESRLGWRLGLGVASAASVCALLFVLMRPAPVSLPSSNPEPMERTLPVLTSHDVQGDSQDSDFRAWLADTTPQGQSELARPLPREPLKGQKRPPCTRYTEVELVGACWAPHELKAPCPEDLFEYQGKCYLPSFSARSLPPQSFGQ